MCFAPRIFRQMLAAGFTVYVCSSFCECRWLILLCPSAQILVMLDACFSQKRRRTAGGQYDAQREHPQSCFLSEEAVKAAEEFVEMLRPSKAERASDQGVPLDEDDRTEEGMQVPNSILDSCHDSFKAADEKRVKASTQYFADTGLMALVCRHDRVLFLANMKSAGEKQYYAFALVFELLKNLPPDVTIGLLYDVACTFERSCRLYGFLGDHLRRFKFAVSVLHAYGHEWACQLVYHPRKCCCFGLCDGEGCERLWAILRYLIGPLRVCGVSVFCWSRAVSTWLIWWLYQFYQRKMILDEQVYHNRRISFMQSAVWLVRKWKAVMSKKGELEAQLAKLRESDEEVLSDSELRSQFAQQVKSQTTPLPRKLLYHLTIMSLSLMLFS